MIPGTLIQADLFADPDQPRLSICDVELRQEVITAYERYRVA